MKKLLVFVVLIAAGLAAAPAIIGMQAETRYQQLLLRLQAFGLSPEAQDYRRGWFSSQADAVLTAQSSAAGALGALRFRLQSEIQHGPVSAAGELLLAKMISELRSAADAGGEFLRLETRFGFDGQGVTEVSASAWEQPRGDQRIGLRLAETAGRVEYDLNGERASGRFSLPQVEIESIPGERMALTHLRWRFERAAVSHGIPLGEARFEAASLALPAHDMRPVAVELKGLEAVFSNQEQDGALHSRIAYAVTEIAVDAQRWGPAGLVFELAGPPTEVVGRMQRQARAGAVGGFDQLGALLANGVRLALRDVSLMTPEGELQAELSISVPPLNDQLRANPFLILGQIRGEAFLQLPEALYFTLAAHGGATGAGPAQRLEGLIAEGRVERHGDLLRSRLRLESGLLTLNERPISLPVGSGLMPGSP